MRDKLEPYIQSLMEAYFVTRDYDRLMQTLTKDFTFIGTGTVEEGCLADMEAYFAKEREIYSGSFILSDIKTSISHISPDVAVALVCLTAESDPATGYVIRIPLRFSVVLRREEGIWKVAHVHNSVPYQEQADESYFNREAARRNHKLVEDVARHLAEDEVAEARLIDPLTNILNLEGFVARAAAVLNSHPDKSFALVKININDFHSFNLIYGYSAGDELLKTVAGTLKACCRELEVCGRVEKDNFSILLRSHNMEETDKRVGELQISLAERGLPGERKTPTCSSGVYLIPHGTCEGIKKMLDKALLAQRSVDCMPGRSGYAYYSKELDEQQLYQAQLMKQAETAMERGEYKLYIQPQVDLVTQQPIAGEALVRWVGPDGSVIMPDDFIPLFERNDFILKFDFYMLEALCKQMRTWMERGIVLAPISINQSRQHLRFPNYIDQFCAIVDRYEIPHRYIAFELTETAFIECNDRVLAMARELHRRGFMLAIDDFGTGYASLNLLGLIAADILKIDRSLLIGFEYSARSRVVLRKVVEMAHESEMTTICEGVETAAQAAYLRELGCDMGQGFYFYRPMPAEQFEKELLLETRR